VDVFVGQDAHDRALSGSFEVLGATRIIHGSGRSFLAESTIHSIQS
jgi:hypothetical protein